MNKHNIPNKYIIEINKNIQLHQNTVFLFLLNNYQGLPIIFYNFNKT